MGLARFRAAARATERISHLVVSRLRLTRIGVGRGLSEVTLHSSRQFRIVSVSLRLRSVMRSLLTNDDGRLRGPRYWRGPAPAASVEDYLARSECSGDLTTEALIGACSLSHQTSLGWTVSLVSHYPSS